MKPYLILSFIVLPFFTIAQDCIDESAINPDCLCFLIYDPVCGCDGEIYDNSCYATQCYGVSSYISATDASGNIMDCANAFQSTVCDSIQIDVLGLTYSISEEQTILVINISTTLPDDFNVGYGGFVLVDENNEVIAYETDDAANVYGFGGTYSDVRYLYFEDIVDFPIEGDIQLVEGYFAGNESVICSYPITYSFEENVSLEGQYYFMSPEFINYFEFTSTELTIYEFYDSDLECYEIIEFEYVANDSLLFLSNIEDEEQLVFPYEINESIFIYDEITTIELVPTSFDTSAWEECGYCSIEIMALEAEECDSNGMFMVTMEIQYENPTAATFTVQGNGTNYGTFEYGQDSYSIGPLLANGEIDYEFAVLDTEDSECYDYFELGYVDCEDFFICSIYDVIVEAEECDSNGYFMVMLDFGVNNSIAATFSVFGNGTTYGSFEYGQENYMLGPLLADGETEYEFVVQDNEDLDCQDFYELGTVECDATSSLTSFYISEKSLLFIKNILGETVLKPKVNVPYIYFYDDGSYEKKVIFAPR
ncbi:MAG: hypothetical protein ISP73_04705 [Flavobacteriales bacterium]|nr:hypothetical protein [Flavobacteriales bacterium]